MRKTQKYTVKLYTYRYMDYIIYKDCTMAVQKLHKT